MTTLTKILIKKNQTMNTARLLISRKGNDAITVRSIVCQRLINNNNNHNNENNNCPSTKSLGSCMTSIFQRNFTVSTMKDESMVQVTKKLTSKKKDGEEKIILPNCNLPPDGGIDEQDEDEMEEMFVEPHPSLGTEQIEWGGPTRGGRFAEPTRFGDWERKGRCTDF